ncbi:pentatricopeptide repeat-containing protein [Tanacetum coccineum]|uniref:Pentatricopeptide repeat-containing protein n=1 Tax=Tanacetum coccineum TaxID=301880 RepID=A0ABQ5IB07_9ASTR
MAPSGSNALLFDVYYDGIFMFAPLRYENGVVYELRVTKDKKYDYDGLCEFLKEKLEQMFYAMFFKLPECELDVSLKIVECDSDLEAMYEFADAYGTIQMIHENRKKDAGNMSYKELVSWAEEEAQHPKTPPKPRTVSKKVWDSLTPKKNDTGACGSGTNVEFSYKQSNAPDATLDVDEFDYGDTGACGSGTNVEFGYKQSNAPGATLDVDEFDYGDTGASVDDQTGAPSQADNENDNLNVMDSDSSDSEVERDQIPDYSMLYSDSESEYSDRSVDYLSEGEDELIQLRKRNSKAKRAPKVSKQKPCSDKEGGEGSSRPKTLYGLGETETILEHEEFMDDLDTHWRMKKPKVGEKFVDAAQFKEYPKKGKLSKWKRYPSKRQDEGAECPWRCYGKQMITENSFQVFFLNDEHTCTRDFKFGTLVNYKWIGNHFGNKIRINPDIKLHEIADMVMKKYKCIVSPCQCRRAKRWALNEGENTMLDHYGYIRSYAKAILESNDGSTVRVGVTVNLDDQTYFDRFYVCFNGLKEGWKKGYRRVIALDGCFLKKPNVGEILTAIGRDGNNHIFPVAWAVVNVENKDNWSWFLELLGEDLELPTGNGLTLMMWQLSGLPCSHAIAVIFKLNRRAEEYVPDCFRKRMFHDAYHHYLTPVSGMSFWPECSKMSKGHNKSGCKNQTVLLPPKPPAKKGRPRKNPIPSESVDGQTKPLVPPSVLIPLVEEHLGFSQYEGRGPRLGRLGAWFGINGNESDSIENTQEEAMHDSKIQESQTVQTTPIQSSQTAASDRIAVDNQAMPVNEPVPREPVPRARTNFVIPRQRGRSERILKRKLAKDHPRTGSSKTNPHSLD